MTATAVLVHWFSTVHGQQVRFSLLALCTAEGLMRSALWQNVPANSALKTLTSGLQRPCRGNALFFANCQGDLQCTYEPNSMGGRCLCR